MVEYEAGDVIWYRHFGGGLRRVLVEHRLADVKHGRPGFDGIVVSEPENGTPVWGYDHQIVPLRVARSRGSATGRVSVVRRRSAWGVTGTAGGSALPALPPPTPSRRPRNSTSPSDGFPGTQTATHFGGKRLESR